MRHLRLIGLAAVLAFSGSSASAGIYTDEMSKCLVRTTTTQDQADLVVWVFSAMSVHPSVKGYASLTQGQRVDITKKASGLMERLLTSSCRKETVEALKYEGSSAIEQSFGVLGQVAMRGLMSDPNVAQSLSGLAEYIDESKFEALAKEAGLVTPSKPASN
jgi:hypothetical protein